MTANKELQDVNGERTQYANCDTRRSQLAQDYHGRPVTETQYHTLQSWKPKLHSPVMETQTPLGSPMVVHSSQISAGRPTTARSDLAAATAAQRGPHPPPLPVPNADRTSHTTLRPRRRRLTPLRRPPARRAAPAPQRADVLEAPPPTQVIADSAPVPPCP